MFYYALVKFRNEQLENYQGQPLKYSASDYHHISRGQARLSKHLRSRSQNGSRRRAQTPAAKETGKRKPSVKEPKSSCTVESYDPFRSPFQRVPDKSPQYARVTIHRDAPETSPKPLEVENDPSNPFLDVDYDEVESQQSPPFKIVRKKRPRVSSVKSFQSKTSLASRRVPNSASNPRSASYKRNVCFRHNRNRSQSSVSVRAKMPHPRRQASEGSLISSLGDDPFSDPQGSPMLPAQPTMVRGAGVGVKHNVQRKVHHSDFIWRDDARKVSHELSQICEEAFNGSSLSTECTDTTCAGSETPATSVSMASAGASHHQMDDGSSTICITEKTPVPSPKASQASKELEETRRKLIEHSTKDGSKDLPGYITTVINHLDRLIEQEKLRHHGKNCREKDSCSPMSDLHSGSSLEPARLSIVSEQLNTIPVRSDSLNAGKDGRQASGSTAASSRRSDISRGKRSIRMVPHSSVQSMGKADPPTVGKTRTNSEQSDVGFDTVTRVTSTHRHSRIPCELDPIDEHPASPRRSAVRTSDHKKWSWFRKSQNIEDDIARKSPRVVKPLHPSSATVIVHEVRPTAETTTAPESPPKLRKPSSDTPKSSFWNFMKRKTNKNPGTSILINLIY